uniref:Uncharacterized protein n=1 Tax=Babesia bovis TaxID=5865 RepID=S6B173_BABBO|nr:conserved hypothetical protein [Babesia bovis]
MLAIIQTRDHWLITKTKRISHNHKYTNSQLNEQLKEALPRLSKMTKYKSNGNTNPMQELEKIFDDLDVSEAYGDMTMNSVNAHLAPQNEVDNLISKVADEYALDIGDMLNASRVIGSSLSNRNIGRLTQ